MRPKYSIAFAEVLQPIREAVTKFGGQPTWLTEPQWPLSRLYGSPMKFVCQLALAPEVFGRQQASMAYLFMTEYSGQGEPPWTWAPTRGENAVLLQPGHWSGPTLPLREGPGLYKGDRKHAVPCEYAVSLMLGEDPDVYDIPESAIGLDDAGDPVVYDEAVWESYLQALFEPKMGGTAVPQDMDARPSPISIGTSPR